MSTHAAKAPDRWRTVLGLAPTGPHHAFRRHSLWVRLCHWINAICLAVLLMSGLNIFNAHPALYWGSGSDFDHPAVMLGALQNNAGEITTGVTSIGSHQIDTTGLLGPRRLMASSHRAVFPAGPPCPAPTGWPWRG